MSVRKRASAIVIHEQKILTILMRDPHSGDEFHTVPGGGIENGEDPADTAVRETREESGFHSAVDVATKLVTRYPFVWKGSTYNCETWWYRGALSRDTPDPVDDEAYILSARWYPVDNVDTLFSHHPVVLSSIQQMVRDV